MKVYGGHYQCEIRPGVKKNSRIIVACENKSKLATITGIHGNYLSRHFSETYIRQEVAAATAKPETVLIVTRLPMGGYEFSEAVQQ